MFPSCQYNQCAHPIPAPHHGSPFASAATWMLMFSLQPVCCTPWGARIRVLSFGSYLLVCLWARNTLDLHLLRKLKVITHQGLLSVFHTSLYSRILIGKHWFLLYYWNHWSKLAIRKASTLTLSPRQQHLLSWFILPDEHYHCSMKTKQMQPYIYIRALSPFKATLLNLLLACILHSCATNGPSRK